MGLDHGICNKSKDVNIVWRKCNQFRGWFSNLNNFVDNGETMVVVETLKMFLEDLKSVSENHELAPEIMPVQHGFFFGSYEYDDWYFSDIETAIKEVTEFLSTAEENDEIYYWEWY